MGVPGSRAALGGVSKELIDTHKTLILSFFGLEKGLFCLFVSFFYIYLTGASIKGGGQLPPCPLYLRPCNDLSKMNNEWTLRSSSGLKWQFSRVCNFTRVDYESFSLIRAKVDRFIRLLPLLGRKSINGIHFQNENSKRYHKNNFLHLWNHK